MRPSSFGKKTQKLRSEVLGLSAPNTSVLKRLLATLFQVWGLRKGHLGGVRGGADLHREDAEGAARAEASRKVPSAPLQATLSQPESFSTIVSFCK